MSKLIDIIARAVVFLMWAGMLVAAVAAELFMFVAACAAAVWYGTENEGEER